MTTIGNWQSAETWKVWQVKVLVLLHKNLMFIRMKPSRSSVGSWYQMFKRFHVIRTMESYPDFPTSVRTWKRQQALLHFSNTPLLFPNVNRSNPKTKYNTPGVFKTGIH